MKFYSFILIVLCFISTAAAQNIELLVVHNIPNEKPATSRASNLVSPAELQALELQRTDSSLLAYRKKGNIYLSIGKKAHVFENIFPYRLNVENFYFQHDSIAVVEKPKLSGVFGRTYDYFEFARAKTSTFSDDTLRIAWGVSPVGGLASKPSNVLLELSDMFGKVILRKDVTDLSNVKIPLATLKVSKPIVVLYSLIEVDGNGTRLGSLSNECYLRFRKEVKKNESLLFYTFSVEFSKKDYVFAFECYNELLCRFSDCKDLMHMRKHYVARMKKLGFDIDF